MAKYSPWDREEHRVSTIKSKHGNNAFRDFGKKGAQVRWKGLKNPARGENK